MDITTFNVNSLRAREERFKLWLEARHPSVLCLQETKVRDEEFPVGIFEERGYSVIYHGQPTYNGVAIAVASGLSVSDPVIGLPPAVEPDQCRFLSLQVEGIRVVNVYVPNGGEVDGPRYAYKLEWLRRLKEHLTAQHSASEPLVVCGDFNVALDDRDVFDPEAHRGQILCSDPERARMAELMSFGLVDLHRKFTQEGGIYTWWDYRNLGFQKNRGFRIDLFLATSTLADRCLSVEIDRAERKGTKPSDHAPVRATFAEGSTGR